MMYQPQLNGGILVPLTEDAFHNLKRDLEDEYYRHQRDYAVQRYREDMDFQEQYERKQLDLHIEYDEALKTGFEELYPYEPPKPKQGFWDKLFDILRRSD